MIGVPGTAHRLFGALREEGISVILISQGSSEHSICCAIPQDQAERAARVVTRGVRARAARKARSRASRSTRTWRSSPSSATAWRALPGVSGKVFNALGAASVNVRAIAQGASERNISVVVDGKDATRALRAVHAGFYLSPHTLSIGLIGPGHRGPRAARSARLAERAPARRVQAGPARARHHDHASACCCRSGGIDLVDGWQRALEAQRDAGGPRQVRRARARRLPAAHGASSTARPSEAVGAALRRTGSQRGIHVVTPNKKANSGRARLLPQSLQGSAPRAAARTISTRPPSAPACRSSRRCATCARPATRSRASKASSPARSPICSTSTTASTPFSRHRARMRRQRGYTEPDPRDDLSGTDVARKLIILGREMGLKLEMADVKVESLVPAGLEKGSIDDFLERPAASTTATCSERFDAARGARQGAALRGPAHRRRQGHGGRRRARCKTHAFANIALTDNVVRFATRRYCNNPLIVQGPGAGPEVTAGGVFADLLRAVPPISERACERPRARNGVRAGFGRQRRHRLRHPRLLRSMRWATRHRRRAREQAGRRDHAPSAASSSDLPRDPEKNTAGRALLAHAGGAEARLRLRDGDRQGHSARLGPRRLGGVRGRARWSRRMRCCRQPLHASSSC